MWPAVTKIVATNRIGTAYGAMFTIQAIGMMLFPWLIGLVLDYTNPGVTEALAAGNWLFMIIPVHSKCLQP
jgi:hypothetical protein